MKREIMKIGRKVWLEWFLSYVLILILSILGGTIIYNVALKDSRRQTELQNRSSMTIMKNEIDNTIKELQTFLDNVAFNQRVQALAARKESFSEQEQFQLYTVYKDLQSIRFLSGCNSVFVYMKNSDYVISSKGNMDFDLYYDLYYKDSGMGREELREYLSGNLFRDIRPLLEEDRREVLLFATSLYSNIGDDRATVVQEIDIDWIDAFIASLKWDESLRLLIIDRENRIVNNESLEGIEELLVYDNLTENENFDAVIQNTSYLASVMESKQTEWKYILLMPKEVLEKGPRAIQRVAVFVWFFCLVIGISLSFWLARRNYNPVQSLISVFKKNGETAGFDTVNELEWLVKQTEQVFQKQADARQVIDQNRRMLKNYYMFRLLEYPYIEDKTQEIPDCYVGMSKETQNVVLLFSIDTGELRQTEEYVERNGLYKFIITNVFSEMIERSYPVMMTELGEEVAAVINLRAEDETVPESLTDIIENTQQLLYERWKLRVIAVFGNLHTGLAGIHASYLEAREAQGYAALLETDLVLYRDIQNLNQNYFYPMERELAIINAIKARDVRSACEYIDQILETNYSKNKISGNMGKCLLFDMAGTICKAMEELGCCENEELDIFKDLSAAKMTLQEIKEQFCFCVEWLCRQSNERKEEQRSRLSEQVKKYIKENYQDPDLNISQTGLYFHITPSYLSSIFKEQTGSSLLVYINAVRMERARELLEHGRSVVETAELVGFRDSGSFIRVFKKHMGITPGQLKKINGGR